jgi:hypothetical protein
MGPLWFTQDGSSIITASGNIFYSSADAMFDMTYRGTLGQGGYTWVVHSAAAGKIAGLHTVYNAVFNPIGYYLQLYEDQQFSFLASSQLPDTPYNNTTYLSEGRFVAFSADSSKLYVIAKSGPAPGVVHSLYTFDP